MQRGWSCFCPGPCTPIPSTTFTCGLEGTETLEGQLEEWQRFTQVPGGALDGASTHPYPGTQNMASDAATFSTWRTLLPRCLPSPNAGVHVLGQLPVNAPFQLAQGMALAHIQACSPSCPPHAGAPHP